MEWFKCLKDFDEMAINVWQCNGGFLMDWEKTWKDSGKLEDHLNENHEDSSVGKERDSKA